MSVWGTCITFNSFGQVMGFLELWPEDFVGFCKNIFIIGDKRRVCPALFIIGRPSGAGPSDGGMT